MTTPWVARLVRDRTQSAKRGYRATVLFVSVAIHCESRRAPFADARWPNLKTAQHDLRRISQLPQETSRHARSVGIRSSTRQSLARTGEKICEGQWRRRWQ